MSDLKVLAKVIIVTFRLWRFFHQMNPHSEPTFSPGFQNEKSLAQGRRGEFEVSLGKPTVVSQLAVSQCFAP